MSNRAWAKLIIFLQSGFSFTDTDDSRKSRGEKATILISYHFHPLTNIQAFAY